MTLNQTEQLNYIKNNFHQYFDLTINEDLETTEAVNLVIPISDISETNVRNLLNAFNDTNIPAEKEVFCIDVIDGDTIRVKDILYDENGMSYLSDDSYKVRFVGIDTPEKNQDGYIKARRFVTELCLYQTLSLNVDDKKEVDIYGRCLAVVIIDNKNLNEILLKLGFAEKSFIPPSEFNPSNWEGPSPIDDPSDNFLHLDKINTLSPYFNEDMTNIVFTPQDNLKTLYPFEVYKEVIYVRLNPFCQNIRMHLLPKAYDCSHNLLIFKDEMSGKVLQKSDDYDYNPQNGFINSYYIKNGEIRDRTNPDISSNPYNPNDWENTFCDFSYDIRNKTRDFNTLQICAGYRYNNSTPYYSIHYTGVRDTTNISIEDRCTLIDANYDGIETKTNNITQYHYDENKNLYIPKAPGDIKESYGDIDHLSSNGIRKLHRKILKYINDELYSEENKQYVSAPWVELLDDE